MKQDLCGQNFQQWLCKKKISGRLGPITESLAEKCQTTWTLQRKARSGATLLLTMDAFFERLESVIGAPVDQIKVGVRLKFQWDSVLTLHWSVGQLIACMLISYPLANLFTKLPRSQPWLRHLFNIGVSSFYLLGVFHLYWGWLQLVVSSLATYVIAKYYKGHRMPWIVFMYVICPMLRGAKER